MVLAVDAVPITRTSKSVFLKPNDLSDTDGTYHIFFDIPKNEMMEKPLQNLATTLREYNLPVRS